MAHLPADRTKLNAAVANQQPSFVASSQANREALVESYDTIDLLNQKVDDAVNAGYLVDGIQSNVDMKGFELRNASLVSVSRPLDGSNRTLLSLIAPDGKQYNLVLRTDNSLAIFNSTDGVTVARFGPTAEGYIGTGNRIATRDLFAETQLFFGSVNSGTVTLSQSINNFPYVLVMTGNVASGDVRTGIARGWDTAGFRIGTDYVNVPTSNGKFSALVTSATQLTISVANDPLRAIYGIKFPTV